MSIEAVEIVILGRPYKVSCPLGQQHALSQAADQLTEKLLELRQRSKVSSNEQLAVMAALNFCHELFLEKEKNSQYSAAVDKRIKMLQDRIEKALAEPEVAEQVEPVKLTLEPVRAGEMAEGAEITDPQEATLPKYTKPSVRSIQF